MTSKAQSVSAEQPQDRRGNMFNKKTIAGIIVLLAADIGFLFLPVGQWLQAAQGYVESLGWLGPFVFFAVYILFTVALIPGTALTIAAGTFFGLLWGSILAIIAANAGALLAFLLGRTLLRQRVEAWLNTRPKFKAVAEAVSKRGFKIAVLLRLSPVFPFTLLNYFMGLTRITVTQYVLANIVGMLPGTIAFVYIGSLTASIAAATEGQGTDKIRLGLQIGGFIATVIVTIVVTRIARKALRDVQGAGEKREGSS